MLNSRSTETQLTKLIEFRQALYDHAFSKRRDAQFELLDALITSPPVRSFPALSQTPVFRRSWPSVYVTLADGRIDLAWVRQYLVEHLPPTSIVVALDGSPGHAPTLPDRQYVYSPTPAIDGGSIVVGLPYLLLSWVAEPHSSWALPLDVMRLPSQRDALVVGVEQVRRFCELRSGQAASALDVVVADGTYGKARFLRALRDAPIGVVVRLRKDRCSTGRLGRIGALVAQRCMARASPLKRLAPGAPRTSTSC